MKFCEKLVTLRKSNKMSQEQLADMLDVSRQAVSKWESGQAYPEMDKLLTLCKIFKCDLNDLTNDEVKEITVAKKKDVVLTFIDDLLEMFNKSITMFRTISSKQLSTLVIEMLFVLFALILLNIPFNYLCRLPFNIFSEFDNSFVHLICNLWYVITKSAYVVLCIVTVAYIYKIRFLDKFDENNVNVVNEKPESKNVKEDNKEEKIVIRQERTSSPVFSFLGTICMVFVKMLAFFTALPFVLSLVVISIFLALSVILITQGIFYFSPVLLCVFSLIGCSIFVEVLFNFIFNNKSNFKRIFLMMIISIIGVGISGGILGFELSTTKFTNEVPSTVTKKTQEKEYPMTDKTIINSNYFYGNLKYEIDNTRKDNFKIVLTYYDDYTEANFSYHNDYLTIDYNSQNFTGFKEMINSLKRREIYNYSELYKIDATIYISSENLEKINKRNEDINKSNVDTRYNDLEIRYNDLDRKYIELENKYNTESEMYRNKIEQYKNAIKNLEM